MSTGKTRVDAWETPLSEEQRWAVYGRMKEYPWQVAMAWAVAEFGVAMPSRQGAYNFSDRMRKQERARRVELALSARDEAGELAALAAPDDQRMIDAYKSLAADMALRCNDAEAALTYTKMALAIDKQRLEKLALELSRDKFEFDASRMAMAQLPRLQAIAGNSGLDDDQKIAAVRAELFGKDAPKA